jgi:Putative translation initiation inhibitor, yjgF family
MKMKSLLLVCLLVSGLQNVWSQSDSSPIWKEKYHSNKSGEDEIGYTQAVKVGNTIYISGSVGWGNMPDAIKMVYDGLEKSLQAYGANFTNVVKENLFTTQLDSVIKYKDIRRNYYHNDYPAATWTEVKRLYSPGVVLEVELVAVLPEKKSKTKP